MKVVIIGGGAAGCSCAARLRRNNEEAKITILEASSDISIANCGLPYFVGNVILGEENLRVSSVQKFKEWFNIDVHLRSRVIGIDTKNKMVATKSGELFSYDRLVLTTGAAPIVPPFEGIDRERLMSVRTIEDAVRIKDEITHKDCQRVVVVGGGFIGLEMAENLVNLGLDVTVVELASQILNIVDEDIATIARKTLEKHGVRVITGDGVDSFIEDEIILKSQKRLPFDAVVMAIGVKPELELARACHLKTDRGIVVDEYLKTSNEDIYAAGDNIEIKNFVTGQKGLIPLAGPANRQGRIIADNLCGKKTAYKDTEGSSVLKIFDKTVATVGVGEKVLEKLNRDYLKTFIYAPSHAGYYPNATQTLYKLLFSEEGTILGAMAIGEEMVEKHIDVIATIMRMHGTVYDMVDAELCYAPPYNSAKDAVNILGMNAVNILEDRVDMAFIEDLEDAMLIDVRPEAAFRQASLEGAINIPVTRLREEHEKIPKDKKVILYCNTGYTSYVSCRILKQLGFDNVYSLAGGITLVKDLA